MFVIGTNLVCLYMDLSQDVTSNVLIKSGEFSGKQLAWELAGLKSLTPWLEVGLGGRLNNVKAGLDLVKTVGNPNAENHSLNRGWFDPILIVRTKGVVNEKWLLRFRSDFGGSVLAPISHGKYKRRQAISFLNSFS